jgi:cytochrome P450
MMNPSGVRPQPTEVDMSESRDTDGRCPVDFDHHSPAIAANPYPAYAKLRESCPVAWSEEHGGYWVLTDYASVYKASQDDATFLSGPCVALPELPYAIRNVPIDTDSPETEQLRAILLPSYTPGAVKKLEPEIAALADELIDEFIGRGTADLVTEFSMPLPARIVMRLIGIDDENWRWYVDRIHGIIHGMTNDPEGVMELGFELAGRIAEHMEERREVEDFSGQLGKLLTAEVNGEPLSDIDVISYVLLLLFGGLDTTTASVANALFALDRDRDLRATLIAHPEKLASAIEEFLRYESPVQALGRTLSQDIELGGQHLRAGDRALLVWASANRDVAEFDNPDEIDIDRKPNRHLAFGVGLHRCLGSNLGRTMFHIMLERLLARLPDYRVTEDPTPYRYPDAAIVFALSHLPVEFTAVTP